MRSAVAVAAALTLAMSGAAGCSGTTSGEAGQCALTVVWRGATYTDLGFHLKQQGLAYDDIRKPRVGERLGTGRVPACEDTPQFDIGVHAIPGVDASTAIVSEQGTVVIAQDAAIPSELIKH